jgi:hypothetical protein
VLVLELELESVFANMTPIALHVRKATLGIRTNRITGITSLLRRCTLNFDDSITPVRFLKLSSKVIEKAVACRFASVSRLWQQNARLRQTVLLSF